MVQRFVAVVALAAAVGAGAGGAATAAPPVPAPPAPTAPAAPAPVPEPGYPAPVIPPSMSPTEALVGDMCRVEPDPVGPTFGDKVDGGPPTPNNGSVYGRFGFAGWRMVPYATGCGDALKAAIPGVSALSSQGVKTAVADRLFAGATVAGGLTVAATRIAFGTHPIFEGLAGALAPFRAVTGPAAFAAFAALALIIAGLVVGTTRLSLSRASTHAARALAMLGVGAATLLWAGNVGPALDGAITSAYRTATGTSDGAAIPDAGTAVGAALVDNLIAPAWTYANLGDGADEDASADLHAAGTFDRGEWLRVQENPAEYERLADAKRGDFAAVASRIETGQPAAFAQLSAVESPNRSMGGLVALAGAAALLAAVGITGGLVAVGRVVIQVVVVFAPAVAAIGIVPRYGWAAAMVVWEVVKRWLVAAGLGVVGFVAYMWLIVGAASGLGWGMLGTLVAYVAGAVGLWAVWHWRGAIASRIGIEKDLDRAALLATPITARYEKRVEAAGASWDARAKSRTAVREERAKERTSAREHVWESHRPAKSGDMETISGLVGGRVASAVGAAEARTSRGYAAAEAYRARKAGRGPTEEGAGPVAKLGRPKQPSLRATPDARQTRREVDMFTAPATKPANPGVGRSGGGRVKSAAQSVAGTAVTAAMTVAAPQKTAATVAVKAATSRAKTGRAYKKG